MNRLYAGGNNGRGSTPEVRDVYVKLGDKNLERMGRDLGILIETTPVFGKAKNNIERYKQLLDSVWVPEKVSLSDYYTLADRLKVSFSYLLGKKRKARIAAEANSRAKQSVKEQHKQRLTGTLTDMVEHYTSVIENCDSKVGEMRAERDLAYERASVSESLALKEVEYVNALAEREKKIKKDMKRLMTAKKHDKLNDCERVLNDTNTSIENDRMKARHYAKQNETYTKRGEDCVERIGYLSFLRGKYLQIITQAKIMLAQISANEFNIANCLVAAEKIAKYNSVMGEAENIVVKQEDAQESSLELAFDNFGFADEYSGSKSFRDTIARSKAEDEKKTSEELKAMKERREKRLDNLLSS